MISLQGIVPKLAAQAHASRIDGAIAEVFRKASFSGFEDVDGLAFTRGPGLSACLDIGLKKVREISLAYNLQTVGINHMEGHALALRLEDPSLEFPFLCLLVSGGHSQIVLVSGVGQYQLLGETLDIAVGDAFDKVARLLRVSDLNGGPALEARASLGRPGTLQIATPMKKYKNCDLSFSGLQTAIDVELAARLASNPGTFISDQEVNDLARSFQDAVITHIIHRLSIATKWCTAQGIETKTIVVSGGVACNASLFQAIARDFSGFGYRVLRPSSALCRDNAVMIGWAAQENVNIGQNIYTPEELQTVRYIPRWPLDGSGTDYFPGTHSAHSKSAILAHREETLAKALESLEETFSAQTAIKVCRTYLSMEKYQEAYDLAQKAMPLFPDDPYLKALGEKVNSRYKSWRNKYT